MAFKYELAVAYRIYPQVAKPALGLPLSHDKLQLADACLRSFRDSLGPIRVKLWALLDGCSREYGDLFLRYFDPEQLVLVPLDNIGNLGTFDRQIDLLLEQTGAELVYFAEDDYFYLPGQFAKMVEFLNANEDADFVSPYDHLDCYQLELHNRPKWLRVSADHHWRTASSTCLTFLTRRDILRQTENIFRSYGRRNSDASLWLSLTKDAIWNPFTLARYCATNSWLTKIILKTWIHGWRQILFGRQRKLWVPVPGIATHMDASALSPAIDWKALIEERSQADFAASALTISRKP
jgi:hypothetical protein